MPSRMSASLATTESTGSAAARREDQRARVDHVRPARVHVPRASRSWRSSPAATGHRRVRRRRDEHILSMASRSYAGRPSTPGRDGEDRARDPHDRGSCSGSDRARVERRVDVAATAATCSAVGGSACRWRSCRRTEPMSMEYAPGRSRGSPRISSVDPPPMSITSTGSAGAGKVAHRAVVREPGLLVAGDHLGIDARAVRGPRRRTPRRSRRRGSRTWRRTGSARPGRRSRTAYSSIAANARGSASSRAGRCGRRPGRAGPSASRLDLTSGRSRP